MVRKNKKNKVSHSSGHTNHEHEKHTTHSVKETKTKNYGMIVFFVVLGLVVVVFASQFMMKGSSDTNDNTIPNMPAENLEGLDAFAQCLTENNAVFYGTEWCGYCGQQKSLFGDSMKFVNYVDCDKDKNTCTAEGIRGYPTWKVNGDPLVGVQSLQILASKTGCTL
jgi:hypothetical protein